jgi:acetyl esterase/lipase
MPPPTRSAPPFDPECGAVWAEVSKTLFAGGSRDVDAGTLAAIRSQPLHARETLLQGRRFEEHPLRIATPAGEMVASVFEPEARAGLAPGMLWIHGGGMVTGDRYAATQALDAAEAAGSVVVSIEYRLAPEHPAPAPVDDCVAALHWLGSNARALGIDPGRLVLGGASAGGGLAAATALRVRDEGGPRLAGLLLCCPMLDDRMTTLSTRQFAEGVLWTRASNEFGWRALLGERFATEAVSIYEAPGRATDLSGLAPTYVDVGSADLFRDESVAFASTIWASGGRAELHVWPGAYHGFELLAPKAALATAAAAARGRWLGRVVAQTST